MGELALVREAGVRGDLGRGKVAALQRLLGPFDSAHDDVLVRRQPGGRLELPRELPVMNQTFDMSRSPGVCSAAERLAVVRWTDTLSQSVTGRRSEKK
jgi:hypothetical protein